MARRSVHHRVQDLGGAAGPRPGLLRTPGRTQPRRRRPLLDPRLGGQVRAAARTDPRRRGRRLAPRGGRGAPRRKHATPHGTRHFKKSDGLLRQGAAEEFAFIRDHRGESPRRGPVPGAGGLPRPASTPGSTDRPARRPSAAGARPGGCARPIETPAPPTARPGCIARLAARRRGLLREHRGQARTPGTTSRSKARRRLVPRTTESRHDRPVPENALAREFYPDRPDTTWVADITYIPTAEELALPGGGARPLLPQGGRLGDRRPPADRPDPGGGTGDGPDSPQVPGPRGCSTTATAGSNTPTMPIAWRHGRSWDRGRA